jgi:hypothetical protein
MRIVLQHKTTGLYFQDVGVWTHTSTDAMDFVSSSAAIEFCQINKIEDLQIVLKFEQERYDIVVQPASAEATATLRHAS